MISREVALYAFERGEHFLQEGFDRLKEFEEKGFPQLVSDAASDWGRAQAYMDLIHTFEAVGEFDEDEMEIFHKTSNVLAEAIMEAANTLELEIPD